MTNYKFSLQSVLDWREDKEEAAKMKVKQVRKEVEQAQMFLQQLIQENIRLNEKLVQTQVIDQLRQQDLYKSLLVERIVKQKLIVEQTENNLKLAEQELLVAYQDKKVMEKLDEKEKERHKDYIQDEEQKQIDEFSTISFGREVY